MSEKIEKSHLLYTMLTRTEKKRLESMENEVINFVKGVLGSDERPAWTGGTAGPQRMIRLLVADQRPPVILAIHPNEMADLTLANLGDKLRQRFRAGRDKV